MSHCHEGSTVSFDPCTYGFDLLCSHPDQAARGASQTNNAVVEIDHTESTAWDGAIAKVCDQLQLSCCSVSAKFISTIIARSLRQNFTHFTSFFISTAFSASALSSYLFASCC